MNPHVTGDYDDDNIDDHRNNTYSAMTSKLVFIVRIT